jgi:hypothetical protein
MGQDLYGLARDRIAWVHPGDPDALLRELIESAALKDIGSRADLRTFAAALERRYPEYGVVAALLILHAGRAEAAPPVPRVEPPPTDDAFPSLFDTAPGVAEPQPQQAHLRSGPKVSRFKRADSCGVVGG